MSIKKRIIRRQATEATTAPVEKVEEAKIEAVTTETAPVASTKRSIRSVRAPAATAPVAEEVAVETKTAAAPTTKRVIKKAAAPVATTAPTTKRVVKKVAAAAAPVAEEVEEELAEEEVVTTETAETAGRHSWDYVPRREVRPAREVEVGGSVLRDDLFKIFQAAVTESETLSPDIIAALSNPTKVKALFETFEAAFHNDVFLKEADVRVFGMKGRVKTSAARISPVPCAEGRWSLIPERAYYKFKPAAIESEETTINLQKDEEGNFYACYYDGDDVVIDEEGEVKLAEFLASKEAQ
jgi:hypothetical protein